MGSTSQRMLSLFRRTSFRGPMPGRRSANPPEDRQKNHRSPVPSRNSFQTGKQPCNLKAGTYRSHRSRQRWLLEHELRDRQPEALPQALPARCTAGKALHDISLAFCVRRPADIDIRPSRLVFLRYSRKFEAQGSSVQAPNNQQDYSGHQGQGHH